MGQYVYQLALHLPRLAPEFEFLLLLDRRLQEGDLPTGCRQVLIGRPFSTQSQSKSGIGAQLLSLYWMNVLVPQVLRRERVDVFHGTNFALPLFTSGCFVATVHDLIYARVPGAFEPKYEKYLSCLVPRSVHRARRVIAVSETTRRDIIELLNAEPERVVTVHHGVEPIYKPDQELEYLERVRRKLDLPERFILHVGAIERRKCLEALVRACARLFNKGRIDALVLAGEEGYGAEGVRRVIAETGVTNQVRYLGYVPQELIPGLYRLATVLTLVSWYEGFGMPVLEAMACGTPVVTANVSALPEVAGDAALLVTPNRPDELERALERVLTDEALRSELRAKGLARAGQFTWEKTAAKHVEVYRQVLEEKRGV
ncbi:MAG: glycosyltransferase family 1 protein [candidate division WOR-3 bacterium]